MSNTQNENNGFKKPVQEVDELMENINNPGDNDDNGKASLQVKSVSKFPVLMMILGCLGLIFSAVAMISSYKAAKTLPDLLKPIVIDFIPFVISFILIKIGVKGLTEGKK